MITCINKKICKIGFGQNKAICVVNNYNNKVNNFMPVLSFMSLALSFN